MKKILPFIFPAAATLIVLLLAWRWFSMKTQREDVEAPFAEGVEIENLSESELNDVLQGVGDYSTVSMTSESEGAMGQIRYEIADGRVKLSINASLPELEEGEYQVWFKEVEGDALRKAFILEMSKGGYLGNAAISESVLPFEVLVSKEVRPDDEVEEVLLRGVVAKTEE